jgi:hypothetical protein
MTNTEAPAATADVLKAVQARIASMIELHDSREGAEMWTEYESWIAFRDTVRTLTCWITADRKITASVSETSVAWIHGDSILGQALDIETAPMGEIVELADRVAQLRW